MYYIIYAISWTTAVYAEIFNGYTPNGKKEKGGNE